MDDIGVAVIGFGLAGSVFHAPLIAATPGLRLQALVTSDPERQRRAGSDYPGTRVVSTFDHLLKEVDDLQLVVVATPNHLHQPQAIAAMERGLHVVVDKPMALSSAEAAAMIATASSRRRLLSVFQNRRFDNDYLLLRQLLGADRLGGVRRLESRFERWRPDLRPGSWREELSPGQGGGLLLDLGSHLIDQALLLFGQPRTVYAELAVRRLGARADDDCFVAIGFEGDIYAHLWMSAVTPSVGPRFRISGSSRALETWGLDPQESQLLRGLLPGGSGFGAAEADQRAELLERGAWAGSGEQLVLPAGRYPDFYSGMAAAIRGEAPVPVPAEAGRAVLRVIEAARLSAATGVVVAMPAGAPTT